MRSIKRILFLAFVTGTAAVLSIYLLMKSRQETAELTDAVRSEAPGKFIRLHHGLVHYSLQGADTSRLLIFVHGGGVTGIEVWRNNIPYFLKQGYRVLSYDLYGRGYSDRPAEENTPELLGDQLIELIDTLGIRAPFDIVAMSLGAIITLDFAVKYPERVNRIVLIDPTATGDYKPSWMIRVPVVSDLVMTCYWHPRAVEHQRKEFVNQSLFEAYAQRLRYFMNFKGYKEMTHATWTHILNQNRLALVKKLPPNRMLILYADRDPFIPKIYLYQQVYPSLKSVLIRDAGHMPHYEKPEEVNPIIGDFLRETTP